MPRRYQVLATNEIYHVFNRSVGHEEILTSKSTLYRISDLTDYYRFSQILSFSLYHLLSKERQKDYFERMKLQPQLVEIIAFAFMPNHYHFLLRQLQDRGIMAFSANVQNAFAKFYNLKYNRHGAIFQSPFKAKRIATDEELLHVSRYIHLNPVTSFIIKFEELELYPWTSFSAYMHEKNDSIVNKDKILKLIFSKEKYYKFVADQEGYQKKLAVIKHLILE